LQDNPVTISTPSTEVVVMKQHTTWHFTDWPHISSQYVFVSPWTTDVEKMTASAQVTAMVEKL
jgi:hypothetical protein